MFSERDANASYESSEVMKLKYEQLITTLRKENKQKRIEMAQSIRVCIGGTIFES